MSKHAAGFTLIETVVTLAITALILLTVLPTLQNPDYLLQAQMQFSSQLELLQNMAQTGQTCCARSDVPEYYFMEYYLTSNFYTAAAAYADGGTVQYKQLALGADRLKFTNCRDDRAAYDPCTIGFRLPDGRLFVQSVDQEIAGELQITISDTEGSRRKIITINPTTGKIN